MAGSLFDQLKKAGLVDEKKAKKAKRQKYQKTKQKKGKKGQETEDDATVAAQHAQQQKVARDRQLNQQQQQQQAKKAEQAALRQLIDSNRLSGYEGEERFNFVDGKRVKTLHVKPAIQRQLAEGAVRIARFNNGYALLPNAAAEKISQRDTTVLIPLAVADAAQSKEEDEHYSQFEVPDDLNW